YWVPTQSVAVGVSSRPLPDELPVFEVVGVDLDEVAPLLWHFILRKDRIHGAWIDAGTTVDALVRVDEIHARSVIRMNAVDRTDLDAGSGLGGYAGVVD